MEKLTFSKADNINKIVAVVMHLFNIKQIC